MASLEIIALDTVTPQLRAPGVGDSYSVPRDMIQVGNGLGYWNIGANNYGMGFNTATTVVDFYAASNNALRLLGSPPYGANVQIRLGFGASAASADIGFERIAAKVVKVTDGASGAGVLQLPTFTVATLPAAATAGAGARASVSDATQTFTSANFGTTVTGGGANFVPVVSDATNWKIG